MFEIQNILLKGSGYVDSSNHENEFLISATGEAYSVFNPQSDQEQLVSFGEEFNSFLPNVDSPHSWFVQQDGDWFVFEDGVKNKLESEEGLFKLNAKETESYYILRQGRSSYDIVAKTNKCTSTFKERRSAFICEYDSYLIFDLSRRNTFVKYDLDFNELAVFEYDEYKSPSLCTQVGYYLFYCLMGSRHDLQVLDLRTFEVVAEYEDTGSTYLSTYKHNETYYFFTGGKLLLWNGGDIEQVDMGGEISSHLFLDDQLYLGFKNDPHLYLFNTKTLKLRTKKRVTNDGYHLWLIKKSGETIAIKAFSDTGNSLLKLGYFSGFKESEFLSDDDFEIKTEQPIYTEQEIYPEDSALFTLVITVDTSHDYVKVIRHTLAIVEDAIERHAARYVAIPDYHLYSENFGGQINFVFEDSSNLDNEQQTALSNSLNKIVNNAKLSNKAYAQGEPQDLSLNVSFV